MYWLSIGFAGGSFIVSVAVLVLIWLVLQSTRRAERSSEERLEMLREQRERLRFLHEERNMLEKELKWRRSVAVGENDLLDLQTPSELNRYSESEQP